MRTAIIAAALAALTLAPDVRAQSFMEDRFNTPDAWWDDGWWKEGRLDRPANHDVVARDVTYAGPAGEVPAKLFRPTDAGRYPAVLFQHGRAGLMEQIVLHARRVAARGFVVLAPDIYAAHFIEPRPIEHDYELEKDVGAGLDFLLSLDDVSTTRACLYSHTRGGYYTLKVAVTQKRQDDAAACYVSYYPHMQDPNAPEPEQVYRYADEANELRIPSLVFIGEDEQYQRRRGIETAINAMREAGLPATLLIYPGVGRGFDFRPAEVRTFADDLASKDALMRAARFMRANLKPHAK